MKKLFTTSYSAGAFNAGILILRLGMGGILMKYGYYKMVHFAEVKAQFINFLGIGQGTSLALVIFAEFFCALFVLLGLFTRLATIPVIIVMCVALFKAHNADFLGEGEKVTIFLAGYLSILFVGPGKISVDGMMGK